MELQISGSAGAYESARQASHWFARGLVLGAIGASFRKLDPVHMMKNPVMFVTEIGALVSTADVVRTLIEDGSVRFIAQITAWLWLTVIFANFAEALAEGRGQAQAAALRRSRTSTTGRRVDADGKEETVAAEQLRKGDRLVVSAGEIIAADGEVIEGSASVNEAAV